MDEAEIEELFSNLNKAKLLSNDYNKALKLEKISVSKYSPGIVQDSEQIARQIYSPIHVDSEGKLTALALDDVFNKGLSVDRLSYINEKTLHQKGFEKQKNDNLKIVASGDSKPKRKYLGFMKADVIEIRHKLEITKRIFGVYDTSLESSLEHADVCIIIRGGYVDSGGNQIPKKVAQMSRRQELRNLFSGILSPDVA